MCTNTSLPPSSLATKPKPLVSSNHLTRPVTATAVEGSGATRRGRGPSLEGRDGRSTTPAMSTSMHSRHLRALRAGADLDLQFRAGRNRLVACVAQGVGVQERVARAAGKLDEAVALVRLEPFDRGVDGWRAGSHRSRRRSAHRRSAKACVRSAAKTAAGLRHRRTSVHHRRNHACAAEIPYPCSCPSKISNRSLFARDASPPLTIAAEQRNSRTSAATRRRRRDAVPHFIEVFKS